MNALAHESAGSGAAVDVPPPDASLSLLLQVVWQRWRQERSCVWSRAQLQRHQAAQLGTLRRFAVERSPFYRRFHQGRTSGPLSDLPILGKATLMAEFDALVTDPQIRLADVERHLAQPAIAQPYLGRYTALSTSGSTGQRGVFLFDRPEWISALAAITRPLLWAGAPTPWQRPRGAMIASTTPWHYSARVGQALASKTLPTLRLDAATPLDQIVQRLNAWQPQLLAVYPSVLLQLADEQLAGRLKIEPKHIGCSAERLPEVTRQRVLQAFGVRVFDTYGATEYAPIAAECVHGNLHLMEDRALVEVVDARGRAVPPGEPGERLLLTVLNRRTQPLIRYEISDRVCEKPGSCACGRPFRMLEKIEGRVEEALSFDAIAGGTVVLHPNLLHALLERVPATGWQVIQDQAGALAITLTGTPQAGLAERLTADLQTLLRQQGAQVPAVQVRWAEALQRGASGKALLIASRRT